MTEAARRLKEMIDKQALTYAELEKRTGIPKSALQRYASGDTVKIPMDRLGKIAQALNTTPAYLMGWPDSVRPAHGLPQGALPVRSFAEIPVIGVVRAGWNGLAYEEEQGFECADVRNPEEYFFLKVTGDSMAPRINEGDLALVHRQSSAESGDVVVALINGDEGTIKKFIRQGSTVILQPFNPAYAPVVLGSDEQEDFRIAGRVVQTVHQW